jgi:hypothetical protein
VDSQIDKLETEIHEHLEIDHGDVTTYINVFDAHPDYIHVMIGKTDNSGKLDFNKLEMFLTEEQFNTFSSFFSTVHSKVYLRDRAGTLEKLRQEWMADFEKQTDFITDDKDHIDLQQPNLIRNIQDSDTIKTKMRNSRNYCVRFYATLCNNDLVYGDYTTGYSWRATGGLIADILGEGDYLNWYCSGGEGNIDDEVQNDLNAIGWKVVPMEVDLSEYKQDKLL